MLIVDAFNVLHASAAAGLGRLDAGVLKALIAQSRWAREHTVLVFDGRGGPGPAGNTARASLLRPVDAGLALDSRESGISEVFAGSGGGGPGAGAAPGVDADTVIESLIEREDDLGRGRRTVVVSSDKRLRAAAAGARARTLTSEAFLNALASDARKRIARRDQSTGGRPLAATDEGADAARTEYWLRAFGVSEQAGPPRGPQVCGPGGDPDDLDGLKALDSLDMDEVLRRQGDAPPPEREENDDGHRGRRGGKKRR